jgi:hypothetical protein
MDIRPPIPSEIRRQVLVEAGHRCSIPSCRHIEVDVHHIIPWTECQTHEYSNLIALCPNCHRRTHRGGDIDRKSLRLYKSNLRFIHDKYSQLEIDILFELNKSESSQGILWLPAMLVLLRRSMESNFINVVRPEGGTALNGMQISPDIIFITDTGREFLENLKKHEL